MVAGIEAVTAEQAHAVAHRALAPEKRMLVAAGPFAKQGV
jgi:hypothetical protein